MSVWHDNYYFFNLCLLGMAGPRFKVIKGAVLLIQAGVQIVHMLGYSPRLEELAIYCHGYDSNLSFDCYALVWVPSYHL